MKSCKKCGLKIPDEALFCIYCGAPYESSTAAVQEKEKEQPKQASTPPQEGGNPLQLHMPSQNDVNANHEHPHPTKEEYSKPSGPEMSILPENKRICPVCGQEQETNRTRCFKCGAEFIINNSMPRQGGNTQPPKTEPVKPSNPVKPIADGNKCICPRCGQVQESDRVKCLRCGATFVVTSNVPPKEIKTSDQTPPTNGSGEALSKDIESWKAEVIRQYLNRVKNKVEMRNKQKRTAVLEKAGLTSRAYTIWSYSNNEHRAEATVLFDSSYPYPSSDQTRQQGNKQVEIQITDQEWETINEAYKTERSLEEETPIESNVSSSNGIANSLKIIGYIAYAAAFILGIVLGMAGGSLRQSFSFGIALACWFAGFAVGTMLLGFGEIIRLLDKISKQNRN